LKYRYFVGIVPGGVADHINAAGRSRVNSDDPGEYDSTFQAGEVESTGTPGFTAAQNASLNKLAKCV
jgi:hypothetical protein